MQPYSYFSGVIAVAITLTETLTLTFPNGTISLVDASTSGTLMVTVAPVNSPPQITYTLPSVGFFPAQEDVVFPLGALEVEITDPDVDFLVAVRSPLLQLHGQMDAGGGAGVGVASRTAAGVGAKARSMSGIPQGFLLSAALVCSQCLFVDASNPNPNLTPNLTPNSNPSRNPNSASISLTGTAQSLTRYLQAIHVMSTPNYYGRASIHLNVWDNGNFGLANTTALGGNPNPNHNPASGALGGPSATSVSPLTGQMQLSASITIPVEFSAVNDAPCVLLVSPSLLYSDLARRLANASAAAAVPIPAPDLNLIGLPAAVSGSSYGAFLAGLMTTNYTAQSVASGAGNAFATANIGGSSSSSSSSSSGQQPYSRVIIVDSSSSHLLTSDGTVIMIVDVDGDTPTPDSNPDAMATLTLTLACKFGSVALPLPLTLPEGQPKPTFSVAHSATVTGEGAVTISNVTLADLNEILKGSVYVPRTSSYSPLDSLTLTVSDALGASSTATMAILVKLDPAPPLLTLSPAYPNPTPNPDLIANLTSTPTPALEFTGPANSVVPLNTTIKVTLPYGNGHRSPAGWNNGHRNLHALVQVSHSATLEVQTISTRTHTIPQVITRTLTL